MITGYEEVKRANEEQQKSLQVFLLVKESLSFENKVSKWLLLRLDKKNVNYVQKIFINHIGCLPYGIRSSSKK